MIKNGLTLTILWWIRWASLSRRTAFIARSFAKHRLRSDRGSPRTPKSSIKCASRISTSWERVRRLSTFTISRIRSRPFNWAKSYSWRKSKTSLSIWARWPCHMSLGRRWVQHSWCLRACYQVLLRNHNDTSSTWLSHRWIFSCASSMTFSTWKWSIRPVLWNAMSFSDRWTLSSLYIASSRNKQRWWTHRSFSRQLGSFIVLLSSKPTMSSSMMKQPSYLTHWSVTSSASNKSSSTWSRMHWSSLTARPYESRPASVLEIKSCTFMS